MIKKVRKEEEDEKEQDEAQSENAIERQAQCHGCSFEFGGTTGSVILKLRLRLAARMTP